MVDRINWGILGNATIARACVIPAIQRSKNGRVAALGSRHPDRAAIVAREQDIPVVYGNYADVIGDPAIHAVYIPLPNHLHCSWSIEALKAGKHVLCEKPMALNAREAARMAAAAQESGVLIMEALMYRFHPRSMRIKTLASKGRIGRPRLIRSAFCFSMADDKMRSPDNHRMMPDTGGGALMDVGCYSVSLARWLFGSEPVHAQGDAVYWKNGVDIHFSGILRFEEDRTAVFEAGFHSSLQQTYSISGDAGIIELPHNAFIPREHDACFTIRGVEDETGKEHIVPGADEYRLMVEHFSDAVAGKVQPAFSVQDSIANMIVLDTLAQAARQKKQIPVPSIAELFGKTCSS